MASTSTLIDTFPGSVINTSNWTVSNSSGTMAVSNGILSQSSTSGSGAYDDLTSVSTYDLTNSYLSCQVLSAGNQTLAGFQAIPLKIDLDASNSVAFIVGTNLLIFQKQVAGAFTTVRGNVTYNKDVHKYFRLIEAWGTIYADYSSDGATWTNYSSLADPFAITALRMTIQTGDFNAEVGSGTAQYANFNFVTPHYKLPNSGLRPHPFSPGLAR